MTTRNDITGDPIASKPATEQYRENFDRIFNRDADTSTGSSKADAVGLCDKCDPKRCCKI